MGLFSGVRRIFGTAGAPPVENGIQYGSPAYTASSAAEVTLDSAMQVSAVWAAVRILSETIGSLPFGLYEIKDGNKVVSQDDLQKILTQNPNQYQTTVEFWESMALNLVLSGNAYAIKQKTETGRIIGLLPVSSSQVQTELLTDGTLIHTYTTGANVKVYTNATMWHVKLFGNGLVGMSPLSYARNSIGVAIAADNRVGKIYSNGAKPSGVLTIDRTLKPEQREQIRTAFRELEEGNQDRLFVLEAGMQYQQVSMSPQDIELLDSRRFQIEDIGRFFGVPSILLNQTFGQSSLGSNVYEIMAAFYKLNLRPYLEKFEASVLRWLIDPKTGVEYVAEFDFDALLRADTSTRLTGYGVAINSGQLTPNEARKNEGRPALVGGDQLLIQGAMVPIQMAGTKPAGVPNATQEP